MNGDQGKGFSFAFIYVHLRFHGLRGTESVDGDGGVAGSSDVDRLEERSVAELRFDEVVSVPGALAGAEEDVGDDTLAEEALAVGGRHRHREKAVAALQLAEFGAIGQGVELRC